MVENYFDFCWSATYKGKSEHQEMSRATSLYLESSVGGDQSDESLDDEAKEESKASDVEIPLGSEAPHVLGNVFT